MRFSVGESTLSVSNGRDGEKHPGYRLSKWEICGLALLDNSLRTTLDNIGVVVYNKSTGELKLIGGGHVGSHLIHWLPASQSRLTLDQP